MEAQTAQPPPSVSSAYPQRVMLKKCCRVDDSSCSTADDAKTLAAARTSTGHLIQVSVRLADEPLAASSVCIKVPDGVEADEYDYNSSVVVAAHGDSLLICVEEQQHRHGPYGYGYRADHFIYNAGDAARDPPRPPSLSLLPPVRRRLAAYALGLLRRGEDELVVAELSTMPVGEDTEVLELYLFRSGEWSVRRPPIISYCGDTGHVVSELPSGWHWDTVIPVGDRQLSWVHLSRYVLICDVFEESPRLQYVWLPMDPCLGTASNRNVCATAGSVALKFVNIFPRCCCGGTGASCCERSRHAYTVHTWMLRMDGAAMEWVKDGIIDATELWALDAYKGLPRIPLERPVMSMDEPHVVYFQLCDRHHVKHGGDDDTLWLLKVDTRSKTIQSVSRHRDGFSYMLHILIPSKGALTTGQRQMSIDRPPVVAADEQPVIIEDDASNPMLQPSSFAEPSEQASEIFEALLDISRYGLDGDELKAYRILSQDNGHRFRSLLRLPKNLRKDWLLMEIKASQAY